MRAFVRADSGKIHVIDEDHPKGMCGQMGAISDVATSMEWYIGAVVYDPNGDICERCAWRYVNYTRHAVKTVCSDCGRECKPWGHTHCRVVEDEE